MNDDRKLLLSALTVVGVAFIWSHVSHKNQSRQDYAGGVLSDDWGNIPVTLIVRSKREMA
jgi:hypothetical protein